MKPPEGSKPLFCALTEVMVRAWWANKELRRVRIVSDPVWVGDCWFYRVQPLLINTKTGVKIPYGHHRSLEEDAIIL
jgi:hypothetical protein